MIKVLFLLVVLAVSVAGYTTEAINRTELAVEVPLTMNENTLLAKVMEWLPKGGAVGTWDGKSVSAVGDPSLNDSDLSKVREISVKALIGISFTATKEQEAEAGLGLLPNNVLLITTDGRNSLALAFYQKKGSDFVADPETAKAVEEKLAPAGKLGA